MSEITRGTWARVRLIPDCLGDGRRRAQDGRTGDGQGNVRPAASLLEA